jgi:hypothetical protein
MAIAAMSEKPSPYRRTAMVAACVLVFFILFETYYLYSDAVGSVQASPSFAAS